MAELAERLGAIPLGKVYRDDRAVGALAERLAPEGGEGDFHRVGVPADRDEPLGEHLRGVQAELAEPFTLEEDPVVVPVGQELTATERMPYVVVVDLMRRVTDPARPEDRLSNVNAHGGGQPKAAVRALDDRVAAPADPPERGTQTARGALLIGVEPEDAGDVGAADRLFVKREESENALSRRREIDGFPITAELERASEGDTDLSSLWSQHHDRTPSPLVGPPPTAEEYLHRKNGAFSHSLCTGPVREDNDHRRIASLLARSKTDDQRTEDRGPR